VGMVLRTLMLMNVLERRLQERKRQHEVHQEGNARSHRPILLTYLSLDTLLLLAVGSLRPSQGQTAEEAGCVPCD
jgi:hypothetical protein